MIIKLSNGKEIILNNIARDKKAEAIEWLRKYKARRQAAPGSPPGGSPMPADLKGGMEK